MGLGARLRQFLPDGGQGKLGFEPASSAELNILSPIRYTFKSRKAAWVAGSLAGFLLTAALVGGIYFQLNQGGPLEYREVFLTDAPAELLGFYLGIDQVLIGPEQYELNRLQSRIDIIAHRGIDGGILIAAGQIPPSRDPFVRVIFNEAEGCFEEGCRPVDIENNVLKVAAGASRAIMVDLDMANSIHTAPPPEGAESAEIAIVFEPKIRTVWSRDPTAAYTDWQEASYDYAIVPAASDPDEGFPRPGIDPNIYPTTEPVGPAVTSAPAVALPASIATSPLGTTSTQPGSTGGGTTTPSAATSTSPASGTATTSPAPATTTSSGSTSGKTSTAITTTTAAPTATTSTSSPSTTTSASPAPTTTSASNVPPDVPSVPSPGDALTGFANSLTLTWNGGDANAGQIVTYSVYFASGNPPTTGGTSKCSGTVRTCFTSTMDWGTTYYWQVKAVDNAASPATTWGPVWRFTTDYAPTTPYSPSPAHGQTGMWIDLNLYWSGGDPDGTTPTHTVRFGTSPDPQSVLCTTTGTTCATGSLGYSTTYYWRVASYDGLLTTTTNDDWRFTTQAAPPPGCDLLTLQTRMSLAISDPCHVKTIAY